MKNLVGQAEPSEDLIAPRSIGTRQLQPFAIVPVAHDRSLL
jgi:hypothetical protein